jgi:hypothetical protein
LQAQIISVGGEHVNYIYRPSLYCAVNTLPVIKAQQWFLRTEIIAVVRRSIRTT